MSDKAGKGIGNQIEKGHRRGMWHSDSDDITTEMDAESG